MSPDLKARADAIIQEYRGDKVADVVAALGWEIAQLTQERDEARSATERFLERAVAAERERCAKIVESPAFGALADKRDLAAAIRAGGSDASERRERDE